MRGHKQTFQEIILFMEGQADSTFFRKGDPDNQSSAQGVENVKNPGQRRNFFKNST